MFKRHLVLVASAALGAGACANDPTDTSYTPDEQGSVKIAVQPWEMDSRAAAACYDIEVTNSSGKRIWREDHVCTNDFSLGNNGDFTYVGICDASGGPNRVRISLESLTADDGTSLGNWSSPPTYTTDIVCVANADVLVEASFLVLTQGEKGFLDVKITTEEVACNAKIDCRSDFLGSSEDADPNQSGVQHDGTIILGLACDAAGDGFTPLYLDDVVLTCTDRDNAEVSVTIDPTTTIGIQTGFPDEFVFGAIGNQGVAEDGTSFWTLQVGVRSGWTNCHLSTRMAASDGRALDTNNQFPVIVADNIDFGFDAAGVFSCEANPLDGVNGQLYSSWASADNLDFAGCFVEQTDAAGNVDISLEVCADLEIP